MRGLGLAAPLSVLFMIWPAFASAQVSPDPRDTYARAVVGLHVTYQMWDEDRPWAKKQPKFRNASAVLIDDTHVLTTAQMLDHATFIRLATFGQPRPYEPRVVYVDHGVNLALLAVDDPEMLDGLVPVKVATETPTSGILRTTRWRQQQLEAASSRVIRFQVGVSWGSRVEHAFLYMRTDMTGGGWADPVFHDASLVGITVSQSDQTSRAIPAEILTAFLERAFGPEPPVSFTALGAAWQVNRDSGLTEFLGQENDPEGVVIRQVPWGTSACGVLEPRDILLELDGEAIDAEGFYEDPRLGRVKYTHIMAIRHRPGDSVPITVLRGGTEVELRITARTYPDELALIPARANGGPPYAIAGGIVMRELNRPYLRTWGNDWAKKAPNGLLARYNFSRNAQSPEHRRWVLITSVLPSPYNIGYQGIRDQIVEKINGQRIDGIPDVLDALRQPQNGFHIIELAPDAVRGIIVLDAGNFDAATQETLEAYSVPAAVRLPSAPLPEGGGDCPGQPRY